MKPVMCAVKGFPGEDRPIEAGSAPGISCTFAEKLPPHVLVVDDEPLIRWSVAESLSHLGLDVEEAADAASALRQVTTAANPFTAVVLDLRLPDMTDLSLLGTLRQLLPAARLVLMTAFTGPEIIESASAMGASVISKPFELEDLNRLVMGGGLA